MVGILLEPRLSRKVHVATNQNRVMIIELDREDLKTLVRGSDPGYTYLNEFEKAGYGSYTGGFVERWDWNYYGLEKCSDEELYEIYKKCKQLRLKNKFK